MVDDPQVEELLKQVPSRAAERLSRRDRVAEAVMGVALLAACAGIATLGGHAAEHVGLRAVGFVLALAVAKRVGFSVGAGHATPTQLVVVPMLLLLPPGLVPVLVACGYAVARLPEYLRRRQHPDHLLLHFGDAWYAVGPALVLALAAPGEPSLAHWPVYVAAIGAQVAADLLSGTLRAWLALGVAPSLQLRLYATVFAIDAALAPLGLLAALAGADAPGASLLVLPLLGLLTVLGRERERRIQHALQLSGAYRGSALLMG